MAPADLLARAVETVPAGRALDLACGLGRHALFLARLGWNVTAVDASRVAIERLRERAAGHAVDARVADLEKGEFAIGAGAWDLICDFFYLQRSLFADIRAGVRPGGLFVATMHLLDDAPDARPRNPDFVLREGELEAAFAGWTLLHYHEGARSDRRRRVAELIARRDT